MLSSIFRTREKYVPFFVLIAVIRIVIIVVFCFLNLSILFFLKKRFNLVSKIVICRLLF